MTTATHDTVKTISSRPVLVYFSGASENTKAFVTNLGFAAHRLPLRRNDKDITIRQPYILVTPTYGGGAEERTVPKQVMTFLNDPTHRAMCVGVIGGGNRNFGNAYVLAARKIAKLLGVPVLFDFEVTGTQDDIHEASRRISALWSTMVDRLSARGFTVVEASSTPLTTNKTDASA